MSVRRLLILASIMLMACDPPREPDPASRPDRRQRDSAVARSRLPGSKGVDRALGVLEASKARAAALDSIH